MTAVIDYVDDFVTLMLGQSGITDLTGQRIFGEVFPRLEFRELWSEPKNVEPSIVIREANDPNLQQRGPTVTISYDVICFGNSPEGARVLAHTIRSLLHDQQSIASTNGRIFMMLFQETAGQGGTDAETKWEFFKTKWTATLFID